MDDASEIRDYGQLIDAVMAINDSADAERFFEAYAHSIRQHRALTVGESRARARAEIGYVFCEGMDIEHRRMWNKAAGIEHPFLGPLTDHDPTPEECLAAGVELGQRLKEHR